MSWIYCDVCEIFLVTGEPTRNLLLIILLCIASCVAVIYVKFSANICFHPICKLVAAHGQAKKIKEITLRAMTSTIWRSVKNIELCILSRVSRVFRFHSRQTRKLSTTRFCGTQYVNFVLYLSVEITKEMCFFFICFAHA